MNSHDMQRRGDQRDFWAKSLWSPAKDIDGACGMLAE